MQAAGHPQPQAHCCPGWANLVERHLPLLLLHLPLLQTERRPVAEANTALSVSNWHEAIRVPQALGLDPRAANLVSSIASQGK